MTQSEEAMKVLDALKATDDRRMFERYQVIHLQLMGYNQKDICSIVARSNKTVSSYIKSYRENGLKGLDMGKSPGAPRKLTENQEHELVQIVAYKTPHEAGFENHYNWTLSIISDFIQREWKQTYTLRGVSRLLEDLGLSYTRPTYILKKADLIKQTEFKNETFPALKKLLNGDIDHILFEDESMIRDYQAIQCSWFLKGKQRLIPTYGQHRGAKLLGTLNYETGEVFVAEAHRYDAKVFLEFLKLVLLKYPDGKIVMILDNARIHHAKLIQPFLEENKARLQLVFLPPYSPELNLVEGFWKWMKETVINNVFYAKVQDILLNVRKFVVDIGRNPDTVINRLCLRM
ncbi:IS630 family transposase [Peribacillus saganii]|uniref:IS630 family transposase n=1 Tax=Peribacillus saganii TaxID=2303992 RepID=UPI002279259B|nr:IS630 family transposase [Peribacillus saganii]